MKSLPTSLLRRVMYTLPLIKSFSKRKELNLSYQAYGAYFKPTEPFQVYKHGLEKYDP